ncbi:NAD(P)/FAD-dependent oxidoreductase [Aquisalimonas asiatica]|uniref:Glycine/D-amino acid oxidase n=1 Tax=Aquisalimonas asiatica TaxID=406100 RepID=A0A1H8Q657_9GAMM|nr:FAD-dependent oxidoreductase [Aquisalimonas asiatica]SEO49451.1 Glycine/D-amino acid oxidase [Aquisalimonas asiatica]
MPRHLDVLVVGQGIAGSLLAYHLIARGLAVCVVDQGEPHGTASRAAAGILSPYTGRRYKAPEDLDTLLAECHRTYRGIETALGTRVFHPQPIWRAVQRPAELADIERRRDERPGDALIGPVQYRDLPRGIHAPMGATRIDGGGQVDMEALLSGLRDWFTERDALIQAQLDPAHVTQPPDGTLAWQTLRAGAVIFCDGAGAFANPWWQSLPWRISRGETVDVEPEQPDTWPTAIVTGPRSMVPIANGRYRIGSTYDHAPSAGMPTAEARQALLGALPALTDGHTAARVVDARTGIRPGSRTGNPFAGFHPVTPGIGILNGLGSRGTLYAPWLARRLTERLVDGVPLPGHVDVAHHPGLRTR